MKAAAFVLLLCTASMFAQSTDISANPLHQKGTWDLAGWVQGGHSVTGGVSGVGAFGAGFRVGKILTKEKGKGWYRGNLEVAADVIPVMLIFQTVPCVSGFSSPCPRDERVYGGGFNPLVFIWNFSTPKKITPFAELGGGVLFTKADVPAFTSDVNFMPQIAFGVHLLTRRRQSVSLAGRYLHISNAGLGDLNPGINTLQFTIGYHWFR